MPDGYDATLDDCDGRLVGRSEVRWRTRFNQATGKLKQRRVTMRTHTISLPNTGDRQLLSRTTFIRLCIGGFIGLMLWEIWARIITVFVLGGPLEPAGLVTSLVQHWTGYELSRPTAEVLHYIIGIVGYPVAYYAISRTLRHWAIILDGGVWVLFTGYVLMTLASSSLTPSIAVFWIVVTLVSATRSVNKNSLVANCLS
jgi:hypothetical protein